MGIFRAHTGTIGCIGIINLWYSISCLLSYTHIPILASAVLLRNPWKVLARGTGVVETLEDQLYSFISPAVGLEVP